MGAVASRLLKSWATPPARSPSLVFVVITRKDGFSLVHTEESWQQQVLAGGWTPAPDATFRPSRVERTFLSDEEAFHNSFGFEHSGIDWGWIHVGLSLRKSEDDLASLCRRTLVLTLVGSLLLVFAFARRIRSSRAARISALTPSRASVATPSPSAGRGRARAPKSAWQPSPPNSTESGGLSSSRCNRSGRPRPAEPDGFAKKASAEGRSREPRT